MFHSIICLIANHETNNFLFACLFIVVILFAMQQHILSVQRSKEEHKQAVIDKQIAHHKIQQVRYMDWITGQRRTKSDEGTKSQKEVTHI